MKEELKKQAMMDEAIASAELSSPQTMDEKPLDKFYNLYEEGRKKGAPQNYIDFFTARQFLLEEISLALTAQKEDLVAKIRKGVETTEPTGCPDGIPGCAVCHTKTVRRDLTAKQILALLDNQSTI